MAIRTRSVILAGTLAVALVACRTRTEPSDGPRSGGGVRASAAAPSSSAPASAASDAGAPVDWATLVANDPDRCVKQVIVGGDAICFEFNRDYHLCLGRNSETSMGEQPKLVVQRYRVLPKHFDQLYLGGEIACGKNGAARPWCWGESDRGLIPGVHGGTTEPTLIDYLVEPVDDLSVLEGNLCARRDDGVWCSYASAELQEVHGLGAPIHQMGAGVGFGCASNEKQVWCWNSGGNTWTFPSVADRGAAGTDLGHIAVPIELPRGVRVKSLHVGTVHGCVHGEDGGVYCFGAAEYGSWGNGKYPDCESSPCPAEFRHAHHVKALASAVQQLGVGGGYACALKTDGTVWCWGANQGHIVREEEFIVKRGQAPFITNYVIEPLPRQRVELGSDNRKLLTGLGHACVEKLDGALWCWGSNAANQFAASDVRSITPRELRLPSPRCQ